MNSLVLIFISVTLGVAGQIAMKLGMKTVGSIGLKDILSTKFFSIIFNPGVFSGVFFYAVALLLWLIVLSREEVSFAYPLISIGYILTAVLAWLFLGESLTLIKFLGILLVVGGVYLIILKI